MAVTIQAIDLAAAIGSNQALADRLLPVASDLVERYAPGAPDVVQNEAVVRCADWLLDRTAAGLQSERFGDVEVTWATGQLSALRHSGGMALLSPWKVRRAGAI